uniref:phage integrase N-terminal SAM-like domain-containing protein n=1 Tax=Thaumasiovibrio subtropicus TaxID=1891207 RepID=UPI001864C1A8|nr:phage integrase N-terminal SAM-like domain-containing protein [Thaumasiovibrio subtropicus]
MQRSPFLRKIETYMYARHYAKSTVDSYIYWIKHFIYYHNKRHPKDLGGAEVEVFLLIAQLMYGSGLRLMECLRLRYADIDYDYLAKKVWQGKAIKPHATAIAMDVSLHDDWRECL